MRSPRSPLASRLGALVLVPAIAVAISSCPEPHEYPGVQIVTFRMEARPSPGGVAECTDAGYTEIPLPDASFTFGAIFSGGEDGTITHMTIQEHVRDAVWDGVFLFSSNTAPRYFGVCGDAGAYEELHIAPISLTQSQALEAMYGEGECPPDPTAPGAIPVNLDAGIRPPGWNGHSFEAVRGCGILRTRFYEVGDKPCPTCTMQFNLVGPRL